MNEDFIDAMAERIDEFERTVLPSRHVYPRFKSRKLDNRTVLRHVMFVLRSGIAWSDLQDLITNHYQTVYQRFASWSKLGALEYAWRTFRSQYVNEHVQDVAYFQNLYIDTTTVKNIGGTDCVGRNPTDKGRRGTKMSAIIDIHKVPLSEPLLFPANVHDSKTTISTVESLAVNIRPDKRRTIKLAGDKAYGCKNNAKHLHTCNAVRLITESKSNAKQPKPIGQKDKRMFKHRIFIEHFFGINKRLKRLRNRADKQASMYQAFWYIAFARCTFKHLNGKLSNNDPAMEV
jgi:transposase